MATRLELQQISLARLAEAKLLFSNNHFDGAAYIIGYVLETALKARICKILDSDYPDSGDISKSFLTHKYENLVKLAGLEKTLDNEKGKNPQFAANWSLISGWKETKRYNPIGSATSTEVLDVIDALENPTYGILTWIQTLW